MAASLTPNDGDGNRGSAYRLGDFKNRRYWPIAQHRTEEYNPLNGSPKAQPYTVVPMQDDAERSANNDRTAGDRPEDSGAHAMFGQNGSGPNRGESPDEGKQSFYSTLPLYSLANAAIPMS